MFFRRLELSAIALDCDCCEENDVFCTLEEICNKSIAGSAIIGGREKLPVEVDFNSFGKCGGSLDPFFALLMSCIATQYICLENLGWPDGLESSQMTLHCSIGSFAL